jgi:hypothetical protein
LPALPHAGKLVGDVLLAAAFVSYAGPFNAPLRAWLVDEAWLPDIATRGIPRSFGGGGGEGGKGGAAAGSGIADLLGLLTNDAAKARPRPAPVLVHSPCDAAGILRAAARPLPRRPGRLLSKLCALLARLRAGPLGGRGPARRRSFHRERRHLRLQLALAAAH